MQVVQSQNAEQINHLLLLFRDHMNQYGYRTLQLPIIEIADLFLVKAGDQIINRLFTFERHGQQMALRPEFTAAAAHWYTQQFKNEIPIVRWQFSGPVFEDDPDNSRLNYQRLSVGAELIGMSGPVAEAEVISMAAHGLAASGITDWNIILGHTGLIRSAITRFKLDSRIQRFLLHNLIALKEKRKNYVLEQLDKFLIGRASNPEDHHPEILDELNTEQVLDILINATPRSSTLGSRTHDDIARRLLQKRQRAAERPQIVAALDLLEQWGHINAPSEKAFVMMRNLILPAELEAQGIVEAWEETVRLLETSGISRDRIYIQPNLARTWEYYTGIVFEVNNRNGDHLAGGGRYDDLTRLVGGYHNVPAVGFAYYVEKILGAMTPHVTPPELPVVTIGYKAICAFDAVQWAHQLRQKGVASQLVPLDSIGREENVSLISETGSISANGRDYTFSQIDDFLVDLRNVL